MSQGDAAIDTEKRDLTRAALTPEMWRILIAVDEARMRTNRHGRYEIDSEERPDRASREKLQRRGFIQHRYDVGRAGWTAWVVTEKGQQYLRDAGYGVMSLWAA